MDGAMRTVIKRKLEEYEGRVPHMYLDSKGYVTAGVGHLLPTVRDAQRLRFVDSTGRPASDDAVAEDYETIKAQIRNRQAGYYRRFAKLSLRNSEIDRLVDHHIDTFHRELRQTYPGFGRFPQQARLAMFDMVFNLGITGMRTGWPRFNHAVREADWEAAARSRIDSM